MGCPQNMNDELENNAGIQTPGPATRFKSCSFMLANSESPMPESTRSGRTASLGCSRAVLIWQKFGACGIITAQILSTTGSLRVFYFDHCSLVCGLI